MSRGFPGGISGLKKKKKPPVNAGDIRDEASITGLDRCPAEGSDNPL